MADNVYGNQYKQTGANSVFTVNNSAGVADSDVDAAVAELRAFIAHLTASGAVGADGTVTDPTAVVEAVESNKGRLGVLVKAVVGGAKDAVLAVVKDGVAALVVALLGRG